MCNPLLPLGLTVFLALGQIGVYGTYDQSSSFLQPKTYSKVEVHRKIATWMEAVETCKGRNSSLLCYTKASHVSQVAAELTFFAFPRMWILNRNCSEPISEPNLSIDLKNLNLSRAQVSYVSHHAFHKEVESQKLPFICFVNVTSSGIAASSLLKAPEIATTATLDNETPTYASCSEVRTDSSETWKAFCKLQHKMCTDKAGQVACGGCLDGFKEDPSNVCVPRTTSPSTLKGKPYLYKCKTHWQDGKQMCEQCQRCQRCSHPRDDAECKPCPWENENECYDEQINKGCKLVTGKLACLDHNDKPAIARIINLIKEIPDVKGIVVLWYAGQKCHDGKDDETSVLRVDLESGLADSYKVGGNYMALCEELDSSAVTTESKPTYTTSALTTESKPTSTTKAVESTSTTSTTVKTTTVSTTRTSTSTTTVSEPRCCPHRTIREITWERKCDGSAYVFKDCPSGATGKARWYCDVAKGEWVPSSPDLHNCTSHFVNELDSNVNRSNVPEALNKLEEHSPVYGGDILGLGKILSEVVLNVKTFIESAQDPAAKKDLALNITEKVVSLGDNMLSDKTVWFDLPEDNRTRAASNLLQDGEYTAFQCAHNLETNQTKSFEKNSFTLQVMKNQKGAFDQGMVLPRPSPESSTISSTFVLPAGFEKSLNDSKHTVVVFFEYKDLADILVVNQVEQTENDTPTLAVNSHVVSVSLNDKQAHVFLEKEATFVVRHANLDADKPRCAFWNMTSLRWDTEGCRLVSSNDSFTECACDHLTNFAVLMDIHGAVDTLTENEQKILQTITQVGCFISIIFLCATIAVTTVYRALWGMRNSVHRNLCICLLIAEVIFVAGGNRTEARVFCAVVAGLLHYFFTAAFCWMFLEAVLIYLLLYKVFSPKKSYAKQFYAVGYGVPLLIVAISAAVRPSGYGTEMACWLSREHGFRWSFVGPVALILLVNFVALAFALYVASQTSKRMNKAGPPVNRAWILGGLALVPLLGSTWILGFVLLRNDSVLIYAFTILNSLQGLGIFIVLCLMNQSSRKCLIKSFGKYTSLISVSSMSSSSNRSTSQSDTRRQSQNRGRRRNSNRTQSDSSPNSPQPLVSPQINSVKNPWMFAPRFLRSISGRFDVSSGEHNDESDICYSTSVGENPSVTLKQTVKHEVSL